MPKAVYFADGTYWYGNERLWTIDQATKRSGYKNYFCIYNAYRFGRLRTMKIAGKRLVPESALQTFLLREHRPTPRDLLFGKLKKTPTKGKKR